MKNVIPLADYRPQICVAAFCRVCGWSGEMLAPEGLPAELVKCPDPECGRVGFMVEDYANK